MRFIFQPHPELDLEFFSLALPQAGPEVGVVDLVEARHGTTEGVYQQPKLPP
jgi:hypothetical protein